MTQQKSKRKGKKVFARKPEGLFTVTQKDQFGVVHEYIVSDFSSKSL